MFVAVASRRLAAPGVVAAVLAACVTGCSNLEVKKVPVAEREARVDHQEGFRYYLNRPYLVVKKPILITEAYSLVKVDPELQSPATEPAPPPMPGAAPASGAAKPVRDVQPTVTFLDGPRRGQTVNLADLQIETPGSGSLRPVSPEELQKLKGVLAAAPAASNGEPTARGDDQVVQAQAPIVITDDGRSITAPPGAALDSTGKPVPVGAAALDATNSSTTDQTLTQVGTVTESPLLSGDMEIIYLPDLDEQYAIKSCNLMAKSSIGLAFKNGSELVEVDGNHDSTTVAIALLQQIQNAIGVAQSVEQARIQSNSKLQAAQQGGKAAADIVGLNPQTQPVWQLVERTWIRPGVYRLNKPWENCGGPEVQPTGCGLLAKLGLPTVVSVDFKPTTTTITTAK